MKIQIREEGSVIPYGVSVTDSISTFRIHVWVRFKVDDTHDRVIHLVFPREHPFESLDWIFDDQIFETPLDDRR